jgi:hypothetical protein
LRPMIQREIGEGDGEETRGGHRHGVGGQRRGA